MALDPRFFTAKKTFEKSMRGIGNDAMSSVFGFVTFVIVMTMLAIIFFEM